jgi:hypothetical protein
LCSQSLRIVCSEDICSHCESRSYAVRNLQEVPCIHPMDGGPLSMENAAPPIKGLLEEQHGSYNGSFYTASDVPTSGGGREAQRRYAAYGSTHGGRDGLFLAMPSGNEGISPYKRTHEHEDCSCASLTQRPITAKTSSFPRR